MRNNNEHTETKTIKRKLTKRKLGVQNSVLWRQDHKHKINNTILRKKRELLQRHIPLTHHHYHHQTGAAYVAIAKSVFLWFILPVYSTVYIMQEKVCVMKLSLILSSSVRLVKEQTPLPLISISYCLYCWYECHHPDS